MAWGVSFTWQEFANFWRKVRQIKSPESSAVYVVCPSHMHLVK